MNMISPHTDPWVLTTPKFGYVPWEMSTLFQLLILSTQACSQGGWYNPHLWTPNLSFVAITAARTSPLQTSHLPHVSSWLSISFLPHLYFLDWFLALFLFIISNSTTYRQWRCHKSSVPLQEHHPPGKAGLSQESGVHYRNSCTDWNKTAGPDGQDLLNNPVTVDPSMWRGSLLPHREHSTGKQLLSNAWKKLRRHNRMLLINVS